LTPGGKEVGTLKQKSPVREWGTKARHWHTLGFQGGGGKKKKRGSKRKREK